jgi:hypothetical protein
MPAHRQSALLLHGLCQADQRWVLSQLPQNDARVLRGHLRELKQLGIPADPSLVPSSAPADAQAGAGHHAATVGRASAAVMQLALAEEPAWMIAKLLALQPWPWRAAFVEGLAPERRAAIAAAPAAALPQQAETALLAAAAGLLAARPAPPVHAGQARPVLRERRKFGRWF